MILDDLVQLHEHIHIYYVVDGYKAELWAKDESVLVEEAEGATIYDAITRLAMKCHDKDLTLSKIRQGRF